MWTYRQATGEILDGDTVVGHGYSGKGEAKDQPDLDCIRGRGPIPRGTWRIGPAFHSALHGPVCLPLAPVKVELHGRSGFLIHGDSLTRPGDASEGCIVLPHEVRERIADSKDRTLEVVSGRSNNVAA